jgi:hypothetical protein
MTKKLRRKFKKPSGPPVKITGPIHVRYTMEGLARIAREMDEREEKERRTGTNFEDREEWRRIWEDLFLKRRGFF